MYYVREYTPTCRFLTIINSTLTTVSLKVVSRKRRLKCTKSYDSFTNN